MYLSLNWLKDFVDLPKKITPEELAERLTLHTVEVDGVESQADKFKNIVVGKILEVKKHPNADRLNLAKVDVKTEVQDIVCGAPNIEAGQKVPVALIGAVLPGGLEIKEAFVRGEKSCGMLCAADELGLGEDHSGIMILDEKAKIGMPLAEYLGMDDIIIEVDNKSITNRPDLWGHYGVAREIAAFLDVELKGYYANPLINAKQSREFGTNMRIDANEIKVEAKVEDFGLCPRYMAAAMDGIKIEPSPKWMRDRLIAAGMRPINNIVDITNYVMLELGQPLHAFDAEKIASGKKSNVREIKLNIRRAKSGETMETLDGEKRNLDESVLVIADKEKALAIAGIMGGTASEIAPETTSIILEAANFNPAFIRKASQKLGLRTESSMRFEKSLDPNLPETALARAAELVKELIPSARVAGNPADEKKFKLNQGPIELDVDWLNKKIGEKFSQEKIISILTKLGFEISQKKKVLAVSIPTWRATKDISIPEDLVEEIARMRGYDNLKPQMPLAEIKAAGFNMQRILERKIKNILVAAGLTEVYNYSFVGEDQLKKSGIDFSSYIKLANPIASNQTLLRQSLAPNLIDNVRTNQAKFEVIKLFEMGDVFLGFPGETIKNNLPGEFLPHQEKRLGTVLSSSEGADVFAESKGLVEYLLSFFNLPCEFASAESAGWQDCASAAKIISLGKDLGIVALLDSDRAKSSGVKKKTAIIEISLNALMALLSKRPEKKYQEFGKFPPAVRDLAFALNEKILYSDIKKEIAGFDPLIKSVELFDVYSGGKLGKGMKSLAFHIVYQAEDRTLTSEEVDVIQQKLIAHLEKKYEAKVRNF